MIVFKTIGTLLLSLLIYSMVFGGPARTFMWNGASIALDRTWMRYTLQDETSTPGCNFRTEAYNELWDNLDEI